MPCDRPPNDVVRELQRRDPGARDLPREQIAECIPGELEINPRRRCKRFYLEVPWNQNLEGVYWI